MRGLRTRRMGLNSTLTDMPQEPRETVRHEISSCRNQFLQLLAVALSAWTLVYPYSALSRLLRKVLVQHLDVPQSTI
jgi:hypothetical protein